MSSLRRTRSLATKISKKGGDEVSCQRYAVYEVSPKMAQAFCPAALHCLLYPDWRMHRKAGARITIIEFCTASAGACNVLLQCILPHCWGMQSFCTGGGASIQCIAPYTWCKHSVYMRLHPAPVGACTHFAQTAHQVAIGMQRFIRVLGGIRNGTRNFFVRVLLKPFHVF